MDWNLAVADYFNLNEEQRDEVVVGLAKFYYDRWINTENPEIFDFTIDELIFRLELEHKFAVKGEVYERAEIYHKLLRIFHQIKEEKEFKNGL
jgi:hypothetical protein